MIGTQEIILILVILLILIGPEKLPEIAKELGGAIRAFQRSSYNVEKMAKSVLTTKVEGKDETLLEIARKLDLKTEGKETKQLINEIVTKIDNKKERNISVEDKVKDT